MQKYNVAVVGATGLVGQTFLKVLTQANRNMKRGIL